MNTNWNELTARERDAVVAEKVFGWKYALLKPSDKALQLVPPDWINPAFHIQAASDEMLATIPKARYGEGGRWFTTDIAAAWLVVKRMREMGFEFKIDSSNRKLTWSALFAKDRMSGHLSADAATESEAICLAACRALGVEV